MNKIKKDIINKLMMNLELKDRILMTLLKRFSIKIYRAGYRDAFKFENGN